MKSNIQYLKEAIEKNEPTDEWIDAIEQELIDKDKEIQNLEDEINNGEDERSELNSKIGELEEEIMSGLGYSEIDFGFDKLIWKAEKGNLKIQDVMEEVNRKYGIGEMQN